MKFLSRIRVLMGVLILFFLGMTFIIPVMAETNPAVIMFDIQGNVHIPAEKILGLISNSKLGEPLDQKQIQLDMQAIMSSGYFSDVHVNTEKMLNGVKLIFEVVENPIYQDLHILGLTKAKPEEIKNYFSQKPGEVFNTTVFKNDLSKAMKFCQEKKGLFVEPKIDSTFGISNDGIVNLQLVELKYGKVKILGLVKTKEVVIRRELSIQEGDTIDKNLLGDEYLKLMRLRLFDGLDMRFEQSESPNSLDLVIEAKEAQTGTFSIGMSYSETTQEIGGLLGYSEANLMGLGQNIALDLNFSDNSRNLQFSFFEPWLDNHHTSFGLSIWNSESSITSRMNSWEQNDTENLYDMDLKRTGLSVSFGKPLWKDTTGNIKFNFEKNNVESFWSDGTNHDLPSIQPNDPNNTVNPNEPYNDHPLEFWDNSAELSLVKNKLSYQDRNFVNGGYQLSLNNTYAGHYLGGAYDYYKAVAEGKWFHAFSSDLVFGTRLQGGIIRGDYPDYDALYLGGMYKLRGYDDRRYHDDTSEQLIGTDYWLSSTELRYRLPANKDLEFVAFYDLGQMNNNGTNALKSDWGLGFRYNISFLGVLRFDQSWNSDGTARLTFSLGEAF